MCRCIHGYGYEEERVREWELASKSVCACDHLPVHTDVRESESHSIILSHKYK